MGTELWANDRTAGARPPRLRGAWFAAAPDTRFDQLDRPLSRALSASRPTGSASLGYDAVLLAVRAARGTGRSGSRSRRAA